MSSAEPLVRLLADGELHSGERLASALGVSRSAVWKIIAELRERGIPVLSVDRRGYRLERAVELLDGASLRAAAARRGRSLPERTEVLFELSSTNDYLYAAPAPPPGEPRLLFAELQTAGRGRRGRTWLAPFGAGLTFSIGYTFAEMPADLSALSLAMGVCVARSLRDMGAPRVMLKWPNDIVHDDRKLGGLLAQLRAESGGPAYVVIGLGLNLRLPETTLLALAADPSAAPVTDLAEACGGTHEPRVVVAASVAAEMLAGLAVFARSGFASFAGEWAALDSLRDAPVHVLRHDGSVAGVARGADVDGALLVETAGSLERVHAGDVSLRRTVPPRQACS
jgi:BirA family transcriptional regulator, biotin operon repressor / biotin---[acetyl-CoA-carboxylase] ligase